MKLKRESSDSFDHFCRGSVGGCPQIVQRLNWVEKQLRAACCGRLIYTSAAALLRASLNSKAVIDWLGH
eukprot:scaffold25258_cov184-Skeletonema_dohrnii-CCMP3373.AAC.8